MEQKRKRSSAAPLCLAPAKALALGALNLVARHLGIFVGVPHKPRSALAIPP